MTWNSEKERNFLKNWFLKKFSIITKQRVIYLNKSLATSLADRKDKYRAYRCQKKRTKIRR